MNCSGSLCALFLRLEKGSNSLKNHAFLKESDTARRRQLCAVLRHKSRGTLTKEAIEFILRQIAIHQQYKITVFSNYRAFGQAQAKMLDKKMPMTFVSYENQRVCLAAAITPLQLAETKKNQRAIYIYVPEYFFRGKRENG